MTESLNSSYKPKGPESELTMNELFGEIRSMLGTSSNKEIIEYLLKEEVFILIKPNKERFTEKFIPYILSRRINNQIKSSLEEKDEFIMFENLSSIAKDLGDEVYEIVGPLINTLKVNSSGFNTLMDLVSKGTFSNLTTLDVSKNDLGTEEARLLAESPHLEKLTDLDIAWNKIGNEGVKALVESPHLTNLTALDIAWNKIGNEGVKALAESPHLANLTTLDVSKNYLGTEEARLLVESPHLTNLTALNLSGNRLGDAGAEALAESPNLKNLRTLVVRENKVRGKGAKALAESPNLVNLTTLDIGCNTIGAKGARALAESPNLKNLRTLDIESNRIRIYSRNKVISHCNDLGIIVII